MRIELTRRVFSLGGRRITDAEARLNWDVGLGVIICFAMILGIVFAWEPHFSWLIFGKVALCASLVLICLSVAFERRAILAAALAFAAMRLAVGAFETKGFVAGGVAFLCCAGALILYVTRDIRK